MDKNCKKEEANIEVISDIEKVQEFDDKTNKIISKAKASRFLGPLLLLLLILTLMTSMTSMISMYEPTFAIWLIGLLVIVLPALIYAAWRWKKRKKGH